MCSCNGHHTDFPPWREPLHAFVWRHRNSLRAAFGLAAAAAALAGLALYWLTPTDIERAEADLRKARAVVITLDAESESQQQDAELHKKRAAEYRKLLDDHKNTTDTELLAWHQAMADGHSQLGRAKDARRENLLHLTAAYLRLLAEAECEILRAKDARDRGTPYCVAPRVRELLAPILTGR